MSSRTRRFTGLGMVAAAGAGFLSLAAMTNTGYAHADGEDIGLVLGGSGTPIPGDGYVYAADSLYLQHVYPDAVTNWYGALTPTASDPLAGFGTGLATPEGLYPLTGVHTLLLNYPAGSDGLPSDSTSVGQGIDILAQQIESNAANGDTSTVFGYSQSSTIAGLTMQRLEADNLIPGHVQVTPDDVKFVLVGDPSAPDGGLLSRFDGFTDTAGVAHSLQLDLPSLGVSFDGATPADDFTTSIYSIEYDGFTDFPKYPLNFLADLNAFLGIETLHGHYLDAAGGEFGPTATDIANAVPLTTANPDSLTDYFMIDTIGGEPVTAPLVALLPTQLQELLGPDLTYLINLGYGDGTQGWSDGPADVNSPFGLFPDVSGSDILSHLASGWQEGLQYLASDTDPYTSNTAAAGQSLAELAAALQADLANPAATLTDFVNAITTASSAAYSALLPTADIINALVTSMPAYDLSLFSANIATGDLADAFGLPIAADTALFTLAGGFELEVLQSTATEISNAFAGLF
jgi:hypothetical protein